MRIRSFTAENHVLIHTAKIAQRRRSVAAACEDVVRRRCRRATTRRQSQVCVQVHLLFNSKLVNARTDISRLPTTKSVGGRHYDGRLLLCMRVDEKGRCQKNWKQAYG